jgi:hypothetical protein
MNAKMIKYLNFKKVQQNNNKNSPDENGKKYLVVMASKFWSFLATFLAVSWKSCQNKLVIVIQS